MNEYKAADGYTIGMAAELILGEKSQPLLDTVVGDPDTMRRPESFAECDE